MTKLSVFGKTQKNGTKHHDYEFETSKFKTDVFSPFKVQTYVIDHAEQHFHYDFDEFHTKNI